jgi:hypothetical protein
VNPVLGGVDLVDPVNTVNPVNSVNPVIVWPLINIFSLVLPTAKSCGYDSVRRQDWDPWRVL